MSIFGFYCFFTLIFLSHQVVGQHLHFIPELTTSPTNGSLKNITSPVQNFTSKATISTAWSSTGIPENNSSWPGYVGAVIAVVFFGSNFVPVKKFETGDGMFFQWVFCAAIWIAGLINNAVQNFPTFYPLAMFGGFLWTTGNIFTVPIIKTIGLGLGLLIWGSFNLLSGWASGRFGMFGLKPESPSNSTLNYLAIGFAMVSAIFWMFVKSQPNEEIVVDEENDAQLINDADPAKVLSAEEKETDQLLNVAKQPQDLPWELRLSTTRRRIIGISLSISSGLLYGLAFAPVIYIKDNYPHASQQDLDYVFAHFCGIFTTSTIYFLIYCIFKKNKPLVYPTIILPAVVSGGMWAAADIAWFIANHYLSEAVSFPIVTTGPGIIASMWGLLVFREVKGLRNYIIMAFAYTFTITGAVLAGFSKS